MYNETLIAAVDLGSNSFRLEIARHENGHIKRVAYLKEMVRQGGGLDTDRNLTPQAMQSGWDCLSRFAERLSGFKPSQVRAVATQTLREARNRDVFLKRGGEILGFPIEVIAGTEEARLIYQGVSNLLPHDQERRLVLDVGGRSTELVLGTGLVASKTASFRLGCVAWSMKYFPSGQLNAAAFAQASVAAQAILDEALDSYPKDRWSKAYGASGTVGAVAEVLALAGFSGTEISLEGVKWLIKAMVRAGHLDNLQLDGLKDERRTVIAGGVSILHALMTMLQIDTLEVAQGALRHGVLYEMVTRDDETADMRDLSVELLAQRFAVDTAQGQRVRQCAIHLLKAMFNGSAKDDSACQRSCQKVGWAAQLHEVGTAISHSDYHKHGAYILDNADMVGFSMTQLHRMGLLILGQRGKLKKIEMELEDGDLAKMLLALRISVILCHARKNPKVVPLRIHCHDPKRQVRLTASTQWCAQFPQSAHLLQQEVVAWQRAPWTFEFVTTE
jgi:exopolyphosphatase/guanosine-5'-triphosphate,3'-diphosphate pyrophosphatase